MGMEAQPSKQQSRRRLFFWLRFTCAAMWLGSNYLVLLGRTTGIRWIDEGVGFMAIATFLAFFIIWLVEIRLTRRTK